MAAVESVRYVPSVGLEASPSPKSLYALLFERAPAAMAVTELAEDGNVEIVRVNRVFADAVGVDPGDLSGVRPAELVPEYDATWLARYREAERSHALVRFEAPGLAGPALRVTLGYLGRSSRGRPRFGMLALDARTRTRVDAPRAQDDGHAAFEGMADAVVTLLGALALGTAHELELRTDEAFDIQGSLTELEEQLAVIPLTPEQQRVLELTVNALRDAHVGTLGGRGGQALEGPRSTRSSAARSSSALAGAERRAKRRILIVDDEPFVTTVLSQVLRDENDVRVEHSARRALDALRAGERFDVILCDLAMPELDGMGFYEALRAFAPEQARHVAFVTGGALTRRSDELLRTCGQPVLTKPFRKAGVLAAVERAAQGGTVPTR